MQYITPLTQFVIMISLIIFHIFVSDIHDSKYGGNFKFTIPDIFQVAPQKYICSLQVYIAYV